ncbi:MAG: hypothetical protein AABX55_01530 [Nanoarchaeota archaeon]
MTYKRLLALVVTSFFLLVTTVSAHCPLCTGAVVAGAVGARYLGLDITIVGIFSGAFAISLALWINRKLKTYFKYQKTLIIIGIFLLTILPALAFVKDATYINLFNKLYFVNKLLLGSIIGGIITLFAYYLHNYIKLKFGKVIIPFQGVILTILLLILVSIPIYFIFS